ncbi:Eaa protein [Escherichia coli]|nr:Eaa protein [Escherichia coli]MDA6126819.1 Eaa protein [Escherichia coli]
MSTITREWLQQAINDYESVRDELPFGLDDYQGNILAALRIALASLEAEPVAYIIQDSDARSRGEKGILRYFANISDEDINEYEITVTPLYAAPPETVSVPAAMEMDDDFDSAFEHGKAVGWNAYRAAMFQSGNFRENKNSSTNNFREIAETSTNYPVIPIEVLSAIQKVAKIRADFDDFDGDRRGIGDCLDEAEQELIVTINKYASQLAAEPIAPNDVREQTAIPQVPVTPDGWVIVPKELTPEMMRAVQIRSELGGYATSNLSGAYIMFSEFWNVAVSAAPKVDDL